MKFMCNFFLTLLSFLMTLASWPKISALAPKTTAIDKIFVEWQKKNSPGLALLVAQDNIIYYKKAYGMADLEKMIPNTTSTVFDIASTSKQFTAFCVALLLEKQRIHLHDPISLFFPELPSYTNGPIKVRDLVYHTSGLPEYLTFMEDKFGKSEYDLYTCTDVITNLTTINNLNFPPGDQFDYCNTNYLLLGELVKRVSGKSLREFAHDEIFQPLGMLHTYFHDNYRVKPFNLAPGYSLDSKNRYQLNVTDLDLVGDGNLHTNVEDLFLWDQNYYNNQLGAATQSIIKLTTTPGKLNNGKSTNYGFGLDISRYGHLPCISHAGLFVGYTSVFLRFPTKKLTIILLANNSDLDPYELAFRVADLFLE